MPYTSLCIFVQVMNWQVLVSNLPMLIIAHFGICQVFIINVDGIYAGVKSVQLTNKRQSILIFPTLFVNCPDLILLLLLLD